MRIFSLNRGILKPGADFDIKPAADGFFLIQDPQRLLLLSREIMIAPHGCHSWHTEDSGQYLWCSDPITRHRLTVSAASILEDAGGQLTLVPELTAVPGHDAVLIWAPELYDSLHFRLSNCTGDSLLPGLIRLGSQQHLTLERIKRRQAWFQTETVRVLESTTVSYHEGKVWLDEKPVESSLKWA